MYLKKKENKKKQEQWWLRRNFYFYHTGLFNLEQIYKTVVWPDIAFCFNEDHFGQIVLLHIAANAFSGHAENTTDIWFEKVWVCLI